MSYLVISRPKAGALPKDIVAAAVPREEVAGLVAGEVARLRGLAEAEGRAVGEEAGQAAVAAAAGGLSAAAEALRVACAELAAPLAQKEADIAALVMDLAFDIASHVIGGEVTAKQESLRTLVMRLIGEAAVERGPAQTLVVRLNPADHLLIAPLLDEEGVHLLADAAITRGGALVEIVSPGGDPEDVTEWDGTIEARIAAMRAALALDVANGGVTS